MCNVSFARRDARVPELDSLRPVSSSKDASGAGDLSLLLRAKSVFSVIRRHWSLLTIAFASIMLRCIIVVRGGQLFFHDEWRVLRTWVVLKRPGGALDYMLTVGPHVPSHWFFTILAIPFALFEALSMWLRGIPLNTETVKANIWVMALGMALFSVACIVLVYLVAKRAGASEFESVAAAIFIAAANTMFYYARHLFSYDAAMALALLALWIGLREGTLWRSFVTGLIAGLAFSTYNGYWTMAAIVVLTHAIYVSSSRVEILKRALVAGSAFVLPIAILEALSRLRGLPSFVGGMVGFAGTITLGSFEEGWKFPTLYLWDSEHLVLIVWLVLAVLAMRRARLWVGLGAAAYLLLALASHAHIFVVYGRTARQVVPFLCLAAGYGLARLPRLASAGVLLLVAIQFAVNISVPLRQHFAPPLGPKQEHPLAWRPYQYEGFTPQVRQAFRAGDYSWWYRIGGR